MTTMRGGKLTAAAALGLGITGGVVALLWLLKIGPFQQDEPGIRVKNGSVYLETLSGDGFVSKGGDFESKRRAKSCFQVEVKTTQSCDGPNPLLGVTTMAFGTIDAPAQLHRIVTAGGKFRTVLNGVWRFEPASNNNKVQHPNTIVKLRRMTAQGTAGAKLECTLGGDLVNDWILVRNVC
jgi:hypothetical protein